jgi:putative membrane protein
VTPEPSAWIADVDGIAVVIALAGAYALVLRRFPTSPVRIALFACGLALILVSHVSPLATISNHYLLSAHLLQNVMIAEWAPALVVAGIPPALAEVLAGAPGMRALTRPQVALPLWLGVYFAWHVPGAYVTALEHPATLLHVEHATYFAAGVLFWWPVLQSRPWALAPAAKAAYLFAAFVLAAPLGLLLALLPQPIYGFYEAAPRLWGLSATTDQQIAGVTMSVEQAIVFFAAFCVYFSRFLRDEEAGEPAST